MCSKKRFLETISRKYGNSHLEFPHNEFIWNILDVQTELRQQKGETAVPRVLLIP